MRIPWGVVYTGWIVAATPFLDFLFKKRATLSLRCNPCTIPSAWYMDFKVDTNLSLHNSLWRIS